MGKPLTLTPAVAAQAVSNRALRFKRTENREHGVFIPRIAIGTFRPRLAFGPNPERAGVRKPSRAVIPISDLRAAGARQPQGPVSNARIS